MKKLLLIMAAIAILAGGFQGYRMYTADAVAVADERPDRNKVLCTCGCKNLAVECGCPAAKKALEEYDSKHGRGV